MIVSDIYELTMLDVIDRNVPNKERIVLIANETIDLGQYGIMIGLKAQGNSAIPIKDNMLWFGNGVINKGDFLFIYTGPGETRETPLPNILEKLYTIHWGRDRTIFYSPEFVPILFRVDAVRVPSSDDTKYLPTY